tara:strand:+ start:6203 stop:7243 length:1041 start_codon:yes stop_codon:yes gene_type:complete
MAEPFDKTFSSEFVPSPEQILGFLKHRRKIADAEQALKDGNAYMFGRTLRTNKPETYATFMPPQPGSMYDPQRTELDIAMTTDLRNTISPLLSPNIFARPNSSALLNDVNANSAPLLSQSQPGTSSRTRSRRGMTSILETPITETQPLLGNINSGSSDNMNRMENMSLMELANAFAEDEKDFDDEINKEIELKKQTGLGNFLARLGGGITLNEKERKALSPKAREKYNQERLSARNKGIGEMLLLLSDALAGRDIVGRAIDRLDARLPEEKSAREKINEELLRVYRALEQAGGNPEKLPEYEKALYKSLIAKEQNYGFPGFVFNSSNNENQEEDEADLIAKKYLPQ